MNQYPPNPGVALGRPSSLGWPLRIGLSHCPRMLTFDHGGTGHQVWLPARGGDEEVSSPPNGLKLTSAESAGQRRWGDSDRADIKDNLDETRGYRPDTHAPPGDASPYGLSSGGSGGFKPVMALLGRDWVDPA